MQGLERLPRLRTLDVSSNAVEDVAGLEQLHELQDLWLNDNQIATLQLLEPAAHSPMGSCLTCLYISGNPCMSADGRTAVLAMFPQLQQIDDDMV